MKMFLILGSALAILTVGTIFYIYKGETGQAPVRLMSPSQFNNTEDLGFAIARRFWPTFRQPFSHTVYVVPEVSIGLQVWQDVQNALTRMAGQPPEASFTVKIFTEASPASVQAPYAKDKYSWYVLPLYLKEEFAGDICANPSSFACLSSLASKRNFRKRKSPDVMSAVIEDHHANNIYIFIHFPSP